MWISQGHTQFFKLNFVICMYHVLLDLGGGGGEGLNKMYV